MSSTASPLSEPKPDPDPGLPFSPRQAFFAILILTALVYSQVATFEFLNFDDQTYVWKNVAVLKGLNWENVQWAFTHGVSGHWAPLTILTHMLDVSLWGWSSFPGGHHLTNVLLHLANVCLLYVFMNRLTARPWLSVIVTALFALHPIHVESVAWISIRKDVLSQFFGLLTLIVYLDYARLLKKGLLKKGTGPFSAPILCRYFLMLALFALGLMSKAVLVTLPASMLLLDLWPLRRCEKATDSDDSRLQTPDSRLSSLSWPNIFLCILEKIPFFALSAFASYMTVQFMEKGSVLVSLKDLPMSNRLENALISYVIYLRRLFLPSDLGTQYAYPLHIPPWQWGGSLIILLLITGFCLLQTRTRPYLIVGWLWFLGTIFPVSGIKQAGMQPMADRYAYLSFIGLYLILAIVGSEFIEKLHIRKTVVAMALCLLGLGMTLLTFVQISYWHDTKTLFSRAVALDDNNFLAHINLGDRFRESGDAAKALGDNDAALGDYDNALEHFFKAESITPHTPHAAKNIALVYMNSKGHLPEAITWYNSAEKIDPTDATPPQNLGWIYLGQQRYNDALREFLICEKIATDKGTDSADPHMGLGAVYSALHDDAKADAEFNKAVALAPTYLNARYNYGVFLYEHHHLPEAKSQFQAILKLDPKHAPTLDYISKHPW